MMDFSGGAGLGTNNDLIPHGQVAWAIVNVRGLKQSGSGGQYLDVELTLDEGQPYGRKKLWDMIGDPNFAGNSEAYRQMGLVAITRMLEAGRGAGPNNPDGYKIQQYKDLSGLRVAVKISIEKGKDGHDDKNRVGEYLTPNPASQSGHKGYQRLVEGKYAPDNAKPAAATAPANGFGGGATQPQQQGGFVGFGSAPGPMTVAGNGFGGGQPSSGFQQPDPAGQQQPGNGAPTTSPSDPTATPAWLAQAGGQH